MSRLGLPDVEIIGNGFDRRAAAVAHENNGLVSLVWATGEIAADSGFVGGLVRSMAVRLDRPTAGKLVCRQSERQKQHRRIGWLWRGRRC